MNKSESIKNLAVALKKAQGEMGEVKFDSSNPFYSSKYASLGAVIEASKKALAANGFSISQPTVTNEFGVGITTLLMHESGEYMESTITLPIADSKNIAQEAGKIVTYLRRYSLASILNLYSDEDTDGNNAGGKKPALKPEPEPKKEPAPMSLKMAESQTGSEGERYGDCTDEQLEGKLIGIRKQLLKTNLATDKRETYELKRDAILTIQKSRAGK